MHTALKHVHRRPRFDAITNWALHRLLHLPYLLYSRVDQGDGTPVLLLHGIANSGKSWLYTASLLQKLPVRTMVFDLLGFGKSPKPVDPWVTYDADDHARAVIRTLKKSAVREPVILVGHSMGCLIAIRVAKLRPDLVDRLVLYQPPFYVGLPRKAEKRTEFYMSAYSRLMQLQPTILDALPFARRAFGRMTGFELTHENWIPSQRSMQQTIMNQTSVAELHELTIPTEIIYGTFDGLVIKDTKNAFFTERADYVTSGEIPEGHVISKRAAKLIYTRVRRFIAAR